MTRLLLPLLGVLAFSFLEVGSAMAADITPTVRSRGAIIDVQRVVRPRARVYVRAYRSSVHFVRRTIGMPCMLPPHVIVQANWNGPQCRWVDNITPRARIRYRIAYR